MSISTDQIYLLNNKAGRVANFVGLGDLIQGAETSAPADGSVSTAKIADSAVTTAKLNDAAVTTAKLNDAGVTLAKLASGVTPSHVVKYAGFFTTLGGSASETITLAGLLATDVAQLTLKVKGATPRTILAAAAAVGQINVTMSGDASTDHVISYVVFRAAT